MATSGAADLIDGVEERFLVLLEIAVVGEREPLQGGEHPGEMADEPAGLSPGQLGDVGVLLLGEHRAPGGVGVVEGDEAELLGRPQDELLADPRQMDAEESQIEEGLGHEVTVGDGVERILEPSGETEIGGHRVGVESERRPGQGATRRAGSRRVGRRCASAGRRRARGPSAWARRWWARRTGWARCMWV